jgi:hypothetical protein
MLTLAQSLEEPTKIHVSSREDDSDLFACRIELVGQQHSRGWFRHYLHPFEDKPHGGDDLIFCGQESQKHCLSAVPLAVG